MFAHITKPWAIVLLLSFAFYQAFKVYQRPPLWLGYTNNKPIQPLSDFPYKCRKIHDPRLQACEDMWLSENTRQLFMACSDPVARQHWLPALGRLNVSGRARDDAVIAMDIDRPKGNSYAYRVMKLSGFNGATGDGRMNVLSVSGIELGNDIKLFFVNNRPPINETTGEVQDATMSGANMTVEVFTAGPNAKELKHGRTVHHARIASANNIAPIPEDDDDAFYFTNDHGPHKTGWRFAYSGHLGTGDVSFCSKQTCKRVASGYRFPNGLLRGRDGLLYVPSTMAGGVTVYKTLANNNLKKVAFIDIDYGIDNLTQDANGDIFAAVLPNAGQTVAAILDNSKHAPVAVVKISRLENGDFTWAKILEDRDSTSLPVSTVALHDFRTGRLFLSGVASNFITVCEPKR